MTAAKKLGGFLFGAAAIAACTINPTPAHADDTNTTVTNWLLTNTEQPTNETASWPQSIFKDGDCGWTQRDTWDTSTPELRAIVDSILADGVLTEGEDEPVILSWEFVYIECAHDQPIADYPVSVPVITDTPAPDVAPVADTPREVAAVDQVAAKTSAPELAATGVDFATPTGAAFLLILGGIILATVKHMKKRESK